MMRVAAALILACGCADFDPAYEFDDVVEVGIVNETFFPPLVAPSTARVGETFPVEVTTLGGGCLRLHSTDTVLTDVEATITPYDVERHLHVENAACTADLVGLRHDVALRFDTPGPKTLRVLGRVSESSKMIDVEVERQIVIE